MADGQETQSHEKTKETYVGKSQLEDDSKKPMLGNQAGEDREKEAHSVKEKPYASIEEGERVKEKEADQGEPETGHHKDEAIRNAEEKYAQAKEAGLAALHDVKECIVHGFGEASYYAAAKSVVLTSIEKGEEVYSYTSVKVRDAGKTALDYTGKKVGEAKDVAVSVGESAVHYVGEKAKELTAHKAVEAIDDAMSYVGEKAVEAKDKAINVGKDVVSYAGEKAIEAKDATLEAGKKALDVGSKKVSSEASNDMLLSVDNSLKKERDFYLAKLQDIENVCQYSSEIEKLPVVSAIQRILEAKNLVTLVSQQQQNDQLEVIAAKDKRKSENQKRKNISSDEVDAAANTKLSPRQRISDASSDVHCIGSPVMNTN